MKLAHVVQRAVQPLVVFVLMQQHGHATVHRRGWNDRFPHVRRRALCTKCMRSHGRKIRQPKLELVSEKETGEPLPMPPVHEWKAMLRRVR